MQPSTLTLAARALQLHLRENTEIALTTDVQIGHPAHVPGSTAQSVSMFFYKVFASGNSGDISNLSPLDVIVHCLITPNGKPDKAPVSPNPEEPIANDISTGENDLTLLGQVMQCFHEYPLISIYDEADTENKTTICEIEVTPLDLSIDELNKIVPTPPKDGYRPSVAYALTLLPMPLAKPLESGPNVQLISYGVNPHMKNTGLESPGHLIKARDVEAVDPTATDPWKPHLYLIDEENKPTYLIRSTPEENIVEIKALVVGPAEANAQIVVERWVPILSDYELVEVREVQGAEFDSPVEFQLSSRVSGQYIVRVQRKISDEVILGNVCVVVIVRKEEA